MKEALKLALEWAESHGEIVFAGGGMGAVTRMNAWAVAIKEALAQPEQEPVAWEQFYPDIGKPQIEVGCAECGVNGGHALYCVVCAEKFVGGYKDSGVPAVETGLEQVSPDTPPKRPWAGLTDEDIAYAYTLEKKFAMQYVDAKLKELNT